MAIKTSTPDDQRFQTGGVLIVSLCHFIHDIYSSFINPLLPLLIEKLSLSLTSAGFLTTVMQLPNLINPLIGMWADRFSVRWFIILAPAATAIPMSLLGVAPSYGVLLIIVFITGISTALFHVPAPVLVSKLSGDYKGRGMSFFMTGGELSRTLGPIIAVGAVSLWGLEGFYPIMVFGLAATAYLYHKFKGIPMFARHRPQPMASTWREMRFILRPVAGILFTRGFMHAVLISFLPTFIKMETGNLWLAGISLTLVESAGVAGVLTAGYLSDMLGRRQVLLASLVLAPGMLCASVYLGGWLRFGALIITGFTLLSTSPVLLAMVQENSKTSPAAANGLYMMFNFMARSSVVVIVGFIADQIGLRSTYLLSALLGFGGIPFILMLPGHKTRS